MTDVLLVLFYEVEIVSWFEDPRPPRELVMAINTGAARIGDDTFDIPLEQSACLVPDMDLVVVSYEPPEVVLTPQLYQVLWRLADGLKTRTIAQELGITTRTVYLHYARLRERFGVLTNDEVLQLAGEIGLI